MWGERMKVDLSKVRWSWKLWIIWILTAVLLLAPLKIVLREFFHLPDLVFWVLFSFSVVAFQLIAYRMSK